MKNNEDILKKILLNMRYDSSKTLNKNNKVIRKRKNVLSEDDEYLDQGSPTITTTTTKPVNNTDKPPRNTNNQIFTKIKSCVDGETFLAPFSSVQTEDKFEPYTPDQWYAVQQREREEGKTNGLDACIYYTEIIRQKEIRNTLKDPNDSASAWFQKQIADCITNSVSALNYQPTGCDRKFYISWEIGEKLINTIGNTKQMMLVYLGTQNWWSAFNGYPAYSRFTKGDKTGEFPLITSPWESLSIRNYAVKYESKVYNFDIKKLESITDEELLKKQDQDPLQNEKYGSKKLDIEKTLPYKDSEVAAMSQNNVVNQDNTVRGVDYTTSSPWCLRDGVTMVNLRSSPGVNIDTGLFDVGSLAGGWNNFVAWKSNKVVGSDTGKRELLWLPLYEYIKYNETGNFRYTRLDNKTANDFLDKVNNYAKSNHSKKIIPKSGPSKNKKIGNQDIDFTSQKSAYIEGEGWFDDDVEDWSLSYLEPYLEDTDLTVRDFWSSVYQAILTIGTQSGYRSAVIPPNTVVNDDNIMAWALDGGAAKYWLEIKLADGSGTVWVNQKNIEPCRLREEDLSTTNKWDAEMKKAEMVSSGNKIYYKTKTIKNIKEKFKLNSSVKKFKGEGDNSNKTESELDIMAEEEWLKMQQDPKLQEDGFKFIDDTTQHTSFQAERFRSMPILPMVIPGIFQQLGLK